MKKSSDESYLVMKVIIVKEVMTCDVSPVAMFGLKYPLENISLQILGRRGHFIINC